MSLTGGTERAWILSSLFSTQLQECACVNFLHKPCENSSALITNTCSQEIKQYRNDKNQ